MPGLHDDVIVMVLAFKSFDETLYLWHHSVFSIRDPRTLNWQKTNILGILWTLWSTYRISHEMCFCYFLFCFGCVSYQRGCVTYAGIVFSERPANERRHYNVTSSLIGWSHAQNCTHILQAYGRQSKGWGLQSLLGREIFCLKTSTLSREHTFICRKYMLLHAHSWHSKSLLYKQNTHIL